MLRQVTYALTFPEGERAHSSMGSVLHGALMELLPRDVADELHRQNLRPFSQALYFDKERNVPLWRLGFLTEESAAACHDALKGVTELCLHRRGYSVGLTEIQTAESDYAGIADRFFRSAEAPRGVTVTFRTPASFKQNGQYIMMPEVGLILNSLLQRWNAFSPRIKLEEDELREHLAQLCRISSYNLHSQNFGIEGQAIHGFVGRLRLYFAANDMQRRLFAVLFQFAPYAGIGIKTALGMGAVDIELHD